MMKFIKHCFLWLLVLPLTNVWAMPACCLRHAVMAAPQQLSPGLPCKSSYKITTGTDHSFGYDIYQDGHLLVHQQFIPCVPGTKGFRKKKDAQRTALLVIQKIHRGIMPPTVSIKELRSMGILQQ